MPQPPDDAPDPSRDSGTVTAALADLQRGLPGAADRLATLVYAELHRLAERAMQREPDGHTLQPTELVGEAFMRLIDQRRVDWQSRAHFYAVAAQTIRRILVDHERARRRAKRDYGLNVTLDQAADEAVGALGGQPLDLIALDDAMTELQQIAPRAARVVELRYFGGLEIDETGEALDVSPATVKRDWIFARAFLLRALADGAG
jgi:RNA polymerase sigma-70 factor, ECF subfamily